MEGQELTCGDCGARFEFSAAEQQQFQARGFAPPKRCRDCRAAKRRRIADHHGEPRGAVRGPALAPIASPRPRPAAEMHAAFHGAVMAIIRTGSVPPPEMLEQLRVMRASYEIPAPPPGHPLH